MRPRDLASSVITSCSCASKKTSAQFRWRLAGVNQSSAKRETTDHAVAVQRFQAVRLGSRVDLQKSQGNATRLATCKGGNDLQHSLGHTPNLRTDSGVQTPSEMISRRLMPNSQPSVMSRKPVPERNRSSNQPAKINEA